LWPDQISLRQTLRRPLRATVLSRARAVFS